MPKKSSSARCAGKPGTRWLPAKKVCRKPCAKNESRSSKSPFLCSKKRTKCPKGSKKDKKSGKCMKKK